MIRLNRYSPLVFIIVLPIIFYIGGYGQYLNVETLLASKDQVQGYINENSVTASLIFIALYTSIVALSLPFASFLTLSAGLLFGLAQGTILVVISATVGACIIFLIARSSFGNLLKEKAGKIYKKIENEMQNNAVSYLLFLRLVPLFPFFLVNIVPALFNIKTRDYIWTTALGILPGTFIYVNVGRSLGTVENPTDLVSTDIILSIALLGIIALMPSLYKKWKGRNNEKI
jgi:uncharacterized membrane protein YdjX (TVP38/TMEM64 family)